MTAARVGVLLPARLETRFDRGRDGGWRLRVIVVPADVWVDEHDPVADTAELDLLEAARASCPEVGGDVAAPGGRAAFERLADQVGPGRAAWLVRTRLVVDAAGSRVDRSGEVPADPGAARGGVVRGLPARLQLWADVDDAAGARQVRLHTFRPRGPDLPVLPPDPADPAPRFWPTWRALRGAGLTAGVRLERHGIEPEAIARLTVVGLGDTPPEALFRAHVDAGRAALLAPGTPTNVVPDSPRATPSVAQVHAALLPAAPPVGGARGGADVAEALTGSPDGLPPMPGGDRDHRGLQADLVRCLWPALWGHALQDLWGPGDRWAASGAAEWLAGNVHPEGPLPTLLVGDQPLALLPLTPLEDAVDDARPPELGIVAGLVEALRRLRDRPGLGTVVGCDDPERLLRLVARTPVSTGYAARWATLLREAPYSPGERDALSAAQADAVAPVLEPAGLDPRAATAPSVAFGEAHPVRLSPVWPRTADGRLDPITEGWLERLLGPDGDVVADEVRALDERGLLKDPVRVLLLTILAAARPCIEDPYGRHLAERLEVAEGWVDSLFFQVLRPSLLEAWRWGAWVAAGEPGPRVEPDTLFGRGGPWPLPPRGDTSWVEAVLKEAVEALGTMAQRDLDGLERTVRATVDAAIHRVDPLAVGLAWRRLSERGDAPRALGLYAWVDRPFVGEPGLADRGLVLAPSADQAKVAAILRDRAASWHESGAAPQDRWDVPLDSERVRLALAVAGAVRDGAHPAEALGREIEALLPDAETVRTFRDTYRQHEEHAGRRTCDGLKTLAAYREGSLTADTGYVPADHARRGLDLLAGVGADLADLLVAEAVHDTVRGGAGRAVAALDAAAGLGIPPEPQVVATPTTGHAVTSTVLIALPRVEGAGSVDRPAAADPSVAHLLDTSFPAPAEWAWSAADGATASLADLGLAVSDLVAVGDDTLDRAARAHLGLAVPADDVATPVTLQPPASLEQLRALVTLLAGLSGPGDPSAAVPPPPTVAEELRAAGEALAADLAAADADAPLSGPLAARALRWGLVAPAGAAHDALRAHLDHPGDADPRTALRQLASPGRAAARIDELCPVLPPVTLSGGAADAGPWREIVTRVRGRLTRIPVGWPAVADPPDRWWTGAPVDPDHPDRGAALTVAFGPGLDPGADVVGGVLDSWTELIPDGEVPATAAFAFRTPGSRAPQAVLLAVPAREGAEVTVDEARAVVALAADLARVRSLRQRDLGPLGALLPSLLLPAGERGGAELQPPGPYDAVSRHAHLRLEPLAGEADADQGLRAELGDPVWALARQWQLGEHQGANAASPVRYRIMARHTPLLPPADRPFADPVSVPGEAVLEAAAEDWPAPGGADPWDTTTLWHRVPLSTGRGGRTEAGAPRHDGGAADWWSVDVRPLGGGSGRPFRPGSGPRIYQGSAGALRYPGCPAPGWFTLERPEESVVAHLPDTAHVASLFFLDVVTGHSTDWYLAGVPTPPGHILTVRSVRVRDVFGDVWPRPGAPWRSDHDDRSTLFRSTGLGPHDLLAWFATTPLPGDVVEQVLLGVDEDADVLWAVEEIRAGEDVAPPEAGLAPVTLGDGDLRTPDVRYQVAAPSPGPWHPYPLVEVGEGTTRRRYRQGRLTVADADGAPLLQPPPDEGVRFLRRTGTRLHEIDPPSVPAGGLRLERRWMLARRRDGSPVLWQQRRRLTPTTAPAHAVGFDRSEVIAES